jgi:hypothetical protein
MATEPDDLIDHAIAPYVQPIGRFVIFFAEIENTVLRGIRRLSDDPVVEALGRDMLFIPRLELLDQLVTRRELTQRQRGQWTNMTGRIRALNQHRRRIVHNPPGGHVHISVNPNSDSPQPPEIRITESLVLSRTGDQGVDHEFQYTAEFIGRQANVARSLIIPMRDLLEEIVSCPGRVS